MGLCFVFSFPSSPLDLLSADFDIDCRLPEAESFLRSELERFSYGLYLVRECLDLDREELLEELEEECLFLCFLGEGDLEEPPDELEKNISTSFIPLKLMYITTGYFHN